jgi:hypothetical protein
MRHLRVPRTQLESIHHQNGSTGFHSSFILRSEYLLLLWCCSIVFVHAVYKKKQRCIRARLIMSVTHLNFLSSNIGYIVLITSPQCCTTECYSKNSSYSIYVNKSKIHSSHIVGSMTHSIHCHGSFMTSDPRRWRVYSIRKIGARTYTWPDILSEISRR